MKKKLILAFICAVALMVAMTVTVFAIEPFKLNVNESTTVSEDYIPSEPSIEETESPVEEIIILENVQFERVEPTTLDEANIALENAIFRRETALAIYEGLLALNYAGDHPAVEMARIDVANTEDEYQYYLEQQKIFQEAYNWEVRKAEYPVATKVWLYMRDTLGWNEYVCAGIMGNMMTECGGQTLNLDPNIRNSSSGCYGICQWHPIYYSQMQGASLDTQLEFLGPSVEEIFNGWAGDVFNISYDEFISLTDYYEVAKYFNNVYERPGYYSSQRGDNAKIAYEYFVD